ncbi:MULTISPECIES: P-II family nitrogen regulator [unclassified Shewanella]|uniref:P-II family nitrogen regulator n=1 Tax=unclassified Shewanella TaxID=196818 RepID=UPI001BC406A5|nr:MULTISPECIES: P-II family nitrogen regulator [unclassified Shewanella]MCG9729656.1 P-II family nitrogen regulator [Shewanella sp. Isolate13]GIU15489.1 nitrogen regulatory protein P-II [Shewanella sp. MBTL60-007]
MRFKLILVFIDDACTDSILDAARSKGATGATVINHARGEGLNKQKTFMGLSLDVQRDVVLLLVEEHLCRSILETVSEVGGFDSDSGKGIAIQIDVEDAVGVAHQVQKLTHDIEDQI